MQKATILSSTATTNAAQDSNTVNIQGSYYHTLYLEWVPGVAANVLTIKVYSRASAGTGEWTQEMDWAISTGTATRTLKQWNHTAASTTVVPLVLPLNNVQGEELKFTYVESDAGGAGKGTLVGKLFSRHP